MFEYVLKIMCVIFKLSVAFHLSGQAGFVANYI